MREYAGKDKLGRRLIPKDGFRFHWRGYGYSPLDDAGVCWVALAKACPQKLGIRKQPSEVKVS